MPTTDPIIDEIHAIREAPAQEAGFDAEKIAEAARQRQVESGVPGVTLPPRLPATFKKKAS